MAWYNKSQTSTPNSFKGNRGVKSNMYSQLQLASPHEYQCLVTKDGKKMGWFFKPPTTHFTCFHRQPMERPDGLYQLQCLQHEENCGAKIFEGSTSVLALCTPTEMDSAQGSERVVLGIVPIIFCNKNFNLHATLSSVQGKLMMKCQDSTCSVIESTVDCDSCLIAPDNLCNALSKVYSIRDRVSRQLFVTCILEFVRARTFQQLQEPKLEYPKPLFQKTTDLLSRMSGNKIDEEIDACFDNIPILTKKKVMAKSVDIKKSKVTSSVKSGSVQKKKMKSIRPVKTVDLDASPNLSEAEDDEQANATSEEDEDME
jgi:hypothetical protein